MARETDYNKRFLETYGPTCRVTVNGQTMGVSGTDVYRLYGATDDHKKFSFGCTQSGKVQLNSDVSIEIVAGEKGSDKGEDIIIHSRRGNVTITADRNGTIKIKGSHIIIEADGDLELSAGNELKLEATSITMDSNNADINAIAGNLAPEGKTFFERVTDGTFIGADVITDTLKDTFKV